jgi:ABC-type antimicrobial peptide transport system permease subunit
LLFGVEPVDPLTIRLAAALLVAGALIAAWIPARTATSVDPLTALRRD